MTYILKLNRYSLNAYSLKILIVDDDTDDSLMLSEAIEKILPSYNFHFEGDGEDALEYIERQDAPDLLFLDVNMPKKNGIDCLKVINDLNLLPDTPIIIYSTSNRENDIDQCYSLGAMSYIVKPSSCKELTRLVKLAISTLGIPKSERLNKQNFVLQSR